MVDDILKEVDLAYAEYDEQLACLRKKEEDYAWEEYFLNKFKEIVELYAQTEQEIQDYYAGIEDDDEDFDEKNKSRSLRRKRMWTHQIKSKSNLLSVRHQSRCLDRVCAIRAREREDEKIFRIELLVAD